LVEVVRTGKINLIAKIKLLALRDRVILKDHDRYALVQCRLVANAAGDCDDMSR